MGMCHHIDTVTCPSCAPYRKNPMVTEYPGYYVSPAPIKHPYKCPVCDGEGKVIDKDSNELLCSMPPQKPKKQCHVCEGKGIVWG